MSVEQPKDDKKACTQCNKKCTQDQFARKQWKKKNPSCRLCAEFTNICQDKSRQCHQCQLTLPRREFDIYQWRNGSQAWCHSCRDASTRKVQDFTRWKELADRTYVCRLHSLVNCNICDLDFTLTNQLARKENALGRDLTNKESNEVISESPKKDLGNIHDMHMIVSRKLCSMVFMSSS